MKKIAVTKQGFAIPLIHKSIFDKSVVKTGDTITATNGKKEFDFNVIAITKAFVICVNPIDGEEYAFDHAGLQLDRFRTFKLVKPCFNFFYFPSYYLIDENSVILDSQEAYYPSIQKKERETKGAIVINRSFRAKGDAPAKVAEVNGLGEHFFHGFREDEEVPFEVRDA